MKILVISDLHLSQVFDQWKFDRIVEAIDSADRVILNGDFWEGFLITFDTFVHSEWNRLFPLLKGKNTVYLYGNHDPEKLSDHRVSSFSDHQELTYTQVIRGKTFLFEHGHRLHPMPVAGEPLSLIWRIRGPIEQFIARRGFREPESYLERMFCRPMNKKIKQAIMKDLSGVDVYVCGHTHAADLDLDQRFVNSGSCCYKFLQYIIIEDGLIRPVTVVRDGG